MTTQHDATGELEEDDVLAEVASWIEQGPSSSEGRADIDPVVRRRRRRRAWIITAVVLAVLLGGSGGYVGWALNAPLPTPLASWETPYAAPGAPAALDLPTAAASAISVAGADAYLGAEASGIWQTTGTDDPRPIASITKLITALVILDAEPLTGPDDPGPMITFGKAAHDLYDRYYVRGATITAMPTGTSMSLQDALATMLIPSASNYAEAVSTWAFGSQSRFLRAARAWLDEHGLSRTTVVDPTGLDPRNTSTPTDLMALGRVAAADPVIAKLAGTRSMRLDAIDSTIVNTNDLLGANGITGLKTGNLGLGTHNLLYTAIVTVGAATLDLRGVIVGGGSHESVNANVLGLIDSIRDGFHDVPVASAGRVVGSVTTPWGETADLIIAADRSIFTWSDTAIDVTLDVSPPQAYADGDRVGTVTWTAGPNSVTAPIEVKGEIAPPTEWWRLTHPGELG